MSIAENKATILRFYDHYNKQELDVCYGELVAPEFVLHSPTGGQSREQVKQFDMMALSAFPDSVCIVENMVAEGDKVAFRVSWTGTQTGEFMGIAPTRKKFQMHNTHIVRIKANRLVEWWGTTEFARILQELGAIPKQQDKNETNMSIREFGEQFIKAEKEAFLTGNCDLLEKLEDPKIVFHFFALNQELTGFEAHKQYISGLRQAAPGIRAEWKYITGDGNVFSALFTTSGAKFTGKASGFPPPTGKEVVVSSLFIFKLDKGKIVEVWSNGTIMGLT
jgi:predicted ester cyclase